MEHLHQPQSNSMKLFLPLLMLFTLSACSNSASSLAGKWNFENATLRFQADTDENTRNELSENETWVRTNSTLEFFKDGKYIFFTEHYQTVGEYEVKENDLVFRYKDMNGIHTTEQWKILVLGKEKLVLEADATSDSDSIVSRTVTYFKPS